MIERDSRPLLRGRVASLHLEYGADSQVCTEDSVEISERGMQLRSRWQFEIGAQLSVSFVCQRPWDEPARLVAEGTVVWCEPCTDESKMYCSTLLFLDLPDELKQSLRELSFPDETR